MSSMLQKSEEESKSHSYRNGAANAPRSHPSQNQDALIEVWRRTASKWDAFDEKVTKPALILAYSYPIPTEIRSNVWFIVSGALDLMRKNRNVYEHLSHAKPSKSADTIEKDLKRTFVDKDANLKYEPHLRRVLIAFSNFNPEIGYTQGMNYIAGFVLRQYFENAASVNIDFHPSTSTHHSPHTASPQRTDHQHHHVAQPTSASHQNTPSRSRETDEYELVSTPSNEADVDSDLLSFNKNSKALIEEKVFWTFVCIMNKIGTLFSDDLPGFHKSVECFSKLLSYHGPTALIHHLNELNVYPIMLSSWYHSLFTYPSMNVNIAKRIWDVFLVEQMDFSIILKISYLIVIRHEQQLQAMDFVEILEFCKSNQCFRFNSKDDHDLIYRASKLQLHETYLKPIRNLKYVEVTKSNTADESKSKDEEENNSNHKSRAQPITLEQSSTNPATASVTNTKPDTIFDSAQSAVYKGVNVSTSSVNSNSSSTSFVKLKASGIAANDLHTKRSTNTETNTNTNTNDALHPSEPLKPETQSNANASKSWRSLLTFGYAK